MVIFLYGETSILIGNLAFRDTRGVSVSFRFQVGHSPWSRGDRIHESR